MRKFEVVVTIIFLSASVLCLAGDKFEYGFNKNDTLSYKISIDGKVHFKELQSLAQLFDLDNINHIANIEVDLIVESLLADRSANIRSIFKKISMVMIFSAPVININNKSTLLTANISPKRKAKRSAL